MVISDGSARATPSHLHPAQELIGLQPQLQERDRSCRFTSDEDGCEVVHLVPRGESVWSVCNQMADYVNARDPQAIDHHANAMLLGNTGLSWCPASRCILAIFEIFADPLETRETLNLAAILSDEVP